LVEGILFVKMRGPMWFATAISVPIHLDFKPLTCHQRPSISPEVGINPKFLNGTGAYMTIQKTRIEETAVPRCR
jgi:hypothetical protein